MSKWMRWSLAAALVVGLGIVSVGLAQDNAKETTLQIEGSTTVGPIMDAFVEAFGKARPEVKIALQKTGSGPGAAALIDGRCDIATLSRFMKPEEFKKAVDKGILPASHAIAMDGVCVIVHPSNPVAELTLAQVRDIYTGKVTNWKDLGGGDLPIVCISRDTSSGTYEVFEEKVMNKEKMTPGIEMVNGNPQAMARVSSTAGAVGYVGLGFVDDKVKALKIGGVTPSKKTVVDGSYPIARPLYMVTNDYPKMGSHLYRYINLYLSKKGQTMIEEIGFIPVTSY